MIDEQQKEALENISLIKDLITESRKELQYTGAAGSPSSGGSTAF